jgi:hypothetical protein
MKKLFQLLDYLHNVIIMMSYLIKYREIKMTIISLILRRTLKIINTRAKIRKHLRSKMTIILHTIAVLLPLRLGMNSK